MPPYPIEWLDESAADVRALDQATAMRLFEGILRFARTGSGDVNALHGDFTGASGSGSVITVSCLLSKTMLCGSLASVIAPEPTAEE